MELDGQVVVTKDGIRSFRSELSDHETGRAPSARLAFRSTASQSSSSSISSMLSWESAPDPGPVSHANVASSSISGETAANRPKQLSYSDRHAYSSFNIANEHFRSKGNVSQRDGRLKIHIHEATNRGWIAKTLGAGIKAHLDLQTREPRKKHHSNLIEGSKDSGSQTASSVPKLNIVIMVIGSRGDIQPFIKIARDLKEGFGHRVRLATHPAFKTFIEEDCGLEFFSVGGNPSELMAFMVKNPGLIPSLDTVKSGEIGRRREAMYEMFQGMWRACIRGSDNDNDPDDFVADAIIANPPSFAHVHCAERLGCPLHIMFTFPYTPTQKFPHPLANIKATNVDTNYTNYMSYPLVELMTWQGLGDLINRFRVDTLDLEPVSTLWAPGQLYRMKVPYTYMWSPALVPKPDDWGPEIDISGFVFLELASNFKPPQDLLDFLDAGDPPVYIGFGSIVVDNPDTFTKLIFDAIKIAGVRALVSKGWGGLGEQGHIPENVYMLENTPHDWLFPRCSAVVHHGGAGTTAIGLKLAKPTMIVPFFGDQPFWGAMVAEAKAGASECIPYKRLTPENLANGIKECLTKDAQANVQKIADSIGSEGDGAKNAVKSFHDHLLANGDISMRCCVFPDLPAVWYAHHRKIPLSTLAVELLLHEHQITPHSLHLLRHYEWNDFTGPGAPLTGGIAAIMHSVHGIGYGVAASSRLAYNDAKKRRRQHDQLKEQERQAKLIMSPPPIAGWPTEPLHRSTTLVQAAKSASGTTALSYLFGLPGSVLLAISQGFHNLPRTFFGDDTVRPPPPIRRVRDFKSGVHVARAEFLDQTEAAWCGFSRLPTRGIQKAKEKALKKAARRKSALAASPLNHLEAERDVAPGATTVSKPTIIADGTADAPTSTETKTPASAVIIGSAKGTAQALVGLLFKQSAALTALPAYPLKGMHVALRRRLGWQVNVVEEVREGRFQQGRNEFEAMSEDEKTAAREAVLAVWQAH